MNILYALPGAFLAPIIHEWVKALCSAGQGDPTPKAKGFLSGNPLKYFEPVGFIMTLLIGFGWGQPVPVSPLYYRDRRKGVLITFITPSVVNLLIGIAAAAAARLILSIAIPAGGGQAVMIAFNLLLSFSHINLGLAVYNLIPVYPMDCSRVLQLFLSPSAVVAYNRNEKILQAVLLLLFFFNIPQDILFAPISGMIFRFVLGA